MKRIFKRTVAIVSALLMLTMCVPMTALAKYENTHTNTGDQAADIIAVAKTQIGYLEGSYGGTVAGSNNYTKYGVWYDDYFNTAGFSYGAWCAMFVSWCAYQAGIPSSTVYYHAYCPYGVDWFADRGLWKDSAYYGGSYTPKQGDIIYFGDSDGSSHVGLVNYSSGGYVYTIEGNTGGQNGEINEGGGCFAKSYSLSYSRILGYGTPKYVSDTRTTATKYGTYEMTSPVYIYDAPGTDNNRLGGLEAGTKIVVQGLDGNWGKIALDDGSYGWVYIGTGYADYIGVDAMYTYMEAAWNEQYLKMVTNNNGSVTLTNTSSTEQVAVDMPLFFGIGNKTTPYFNISVSRHYGGWYFGMTKKGLTVFAMRECTSGNQLVAATSATYMQTDEQLEIDIGYWWAPTDRTNKIDLVRVYLDADSSITINYCYFADEAGVIRSDAYNMRRPEVLIDPVNLLDPDTLTIPNRTKTGSYSYQNGTLTVVSGEANGYEVAMTPNKTVRPEEVSRWLLSVNSDIRFDIELLVTTSDGERTFSLRDDFYKSFSEQADGDYIPAMSGSAGLDLLSCFTWNDVLPADGNSVVKKVTFRLGGVGTLVVNSLQLAANDQLTMFTDTVSKQDSTPDAVVTPSGDVNGDGSVTTADARLILSHLLGNGDTLNANQQAIADFDGNGELSTADVRTMLKAVLG